MGKTLTALCFIACGAVVGSLLTIFAWVPTDTCMAPCTVKFYSPMAEDDLRFDYTNGEFRVWKETNH